MRNKITIRNIFDFLIQLYIIIIMTSSNTGTIAVKGIRIVIVAFFAIYLISEKKIYHTGYGKWAVVFFTLNVLLIKYAYNSSIAKQYTLSLLYVMIINLLICQYVFKNKIFNKIFNAIIIGAVLEASIVFLKYGFLVCINNRFGEYGSANSIGLYSAIAFSLCICFINNSNIKNKKIVYYILLVLNAIAVILSASRKAIIFTLVPIFIFYFAKSSNPLKMIKHIVIVLLIALLSYYLLMNVPFFYDTVGNRIESMISGIKGGKTDSSTSTRMYLIDDGLKWLKQKPLLGNGPANYRALHASHYHGSLLYAHNNYIELLVDVGIIGTITYYILYLKIICAALNKKIKKNETNLIVIGMFFSIIIGEFGLVTYDDAFIQLFLMTILLYFNNQKAKGCNYNEI